MNGKRLNDLTNEEKEKVFVPGTVLEYSDMANLPSEYVITKITSGKFGKTATLRTNGRDDFLSIDAGFQYGWRIVKVY